MITITGITNSQYPNKSLVYFDIDTDSITTYQWQALVPALSGQTLQEYLDSNEAKYINDILSKEEIWADSATPKTREIVNPDGSTTIVDIPKSEVVFPTLLWPEDTFNSTLFLGRVIQVLSPLRWVELSKLGVGWSMQQLIDYPDVKANCFSRLKEYLGALQMDGTLTPEEIVTIYEIVLEQGVDLSLSSF